MDGTKREATRRRLLGRTLGLGVMGPLAVLHAACAGGESQPAASQEPVTLLMVNSGAIPPGWGDLGQAFTREYPRVTVEFTGTEGGSWGQYFEKVAVMSASGAPPDVARVAIEGVQLVAHRGMALPLDPFIKRDQAQLKDYFPDVNQNMLKSMAYQGKQYQLPFTWNGPVVHYNTTLFERAGIRRPKDDWSLDDFLDAARRLTTEGVWGVTAPNGYWGGVIPWLFLNGADLFTDDWKQSRAGDPRVVEALQLYLDLSAKHRVAPPAGAGADFNTGKLAMRADGGGNLRLDMIQRGMRDFDVLPFPRWKTQTHEYGGTGFPIMKGSKHHEESWLLTRFLIRKESIASFCASVSQTPARRSVAYDMWVKAGDPPAHHRLYFDVLDRGARSVPAPPEFNEVEALTLKALRQLTANETSARSAADGLHRELSELLARRSPPAG